MFVNYDLNYELSDEIIIDLRLKKFLNFSNDVYKFRFILNYLLSNYFMEEYDHNNKLIRFNINNKFKYFLKQSNKYYGSDYSFDGVINLLKNFVKKNEFVIEI